MPARVSSECAAGASGSEGPFDPSDAFEGHGHRAATAQAEGGEAEATAPQAQLME